MDKGAFTSATCALPFCGYRSLHLCYLCNAFHSCTWSPRTHTHTFTNGYLATFDYSLQAIERSSKWQALGRACAPPAFSSRILYLSSYLPSLFPYYCSRLRMQPPIVKYLRATKNWFPRFENPEPLIFRPSTLAIWETPLLILLSFTNLLYMCK